MFATWLVIEPILRTELLFRCFELTPNLLSNANQYASIAVSFYDLKIVFNNHFSAILYFSEYPLVKKNYLIYLFTFDYIFVLFFNYRKILKLWNPVSFFSSIFRFVRSSALIFPSKYSYQRNYICFALLTPNVNIRTTLKCHTKFEQVC